MDIKYKSLPIRFEKIDDSNSIDERFTPVRIFLCHTGENLNGSVFTKEVLESMIPSLSKIPIVGYISSNNFNEEDFKGHEMRLVISEDGIDVEYLGSAYGLISENNNARFEMKLCDDGVEREFLVCDGFLWNKFKECIDIFDRDQVKSQSMELFPDSIKGNFSKEDKLFYFTDAKFEAACILGKNTVPAMTGSVVEKYTKTNFTQSLKEMINEFVEFANSDDKTGEKIEIDNSKESANMTGAWSTVNKTSLRKKVVAASNATSLVKETFLIVDNSWEDSPSESLHYPHHEVKDGKLIVHKAGVEAAYARLMQNDPENKKALKHIRKHYKELGLSLENFALEGGSQVEEIQALLQKYSLTLDDLEAKEINYSDFSLEGLDAKIQEVFEIKPDNQSQYSWSSEQLEDELRRVVCSNKVVDNWGYEYSQYWYVDNLPDEKMVIVYDYDDCYYVGFPFDINGDVVTIDMSSEIRYKSEWVKMNVAPDDDLGATFSSLPQEVIEYKLKVKEAELAKQFETEKEQIVQDQKSAFEQIQSEFNTLKEQYSTLETRANQIESELSTKVQKEREDAENQIFESFSKELTEEEMSEIKSKKSEFSLEDLQDKLFALVGKKKAKFSLKDDNKPLRINVFENQKQSDKSWADLVEQYKQ